jgi:hypothetical protein
MSYYENIALQTPLLLLDVLMLATVPIGTALWVVFADVLMILFGLFGAITSHHYRLGSCCQNANYVDSTQRYHLLATESRCTVIDFVEATPILEWTCAMHGSCRFVLPPAYNQPGSMLCY